MSYSTLYVFGPDGLASNHEEFRNGWGSAPRVWDALVKRHKTAMYPDRQERDLEYVNGLSNAEDLWKMAEDGRLALAWWELNLLRWTYDQSYLKREDFQLMVESIEAFETAYPAGGRVNHLPRLAKILSALSKERVVQGAGFQHTSVSDDCWRVYDSVEDEARPYDLNRDSSHHVLPMVSRSVDAPREAPVEPPV